MDEHKELFNQSISHLDTIQFCFSNPDSLLYVQLTRHQTLYILVPAACLLYWRNPGIRPGSALQQHLLHSCSSEVNRCSGWALAWLWKSQPRAFVSCRRKCLYTVFANSKLHIPPTDLLNHCKGQQRNPGATWHVFVASWYSNCRSSMYFLAVRKAQLNKQG